MAQKEKDILYKMTDIDGNFITDFYIVQTVGWSFTNAVIKYEAVGNDGGFTTQTGELIVTIPVTVQLIGTLRENMSFLRKLKDTKKPVTIFSIIDTANLFGNYLIEDASTNIIDGQDTMLVNINFVEYKDVNIDRLNLVIPESKSFENLLNFLENQNFIDKR